MSKAQPQEMVEFKKSIIDDLDEVPVIKVGTMSQADLEERLGYFARRARTLNGLITVKEADGRLVQKPIGAQVASFFDNLLKSTTDPEMIRKRSEFFDKLQNGDPVTKHQFAAARMESFDNFLMARLDWINQYATVQTLGEDEWPIEQNTTKTEVTCYYVGEKGTAKLQKLTKDLPELRVPIRLLTTPVVRYTEMDLYRGNIVQAALETINLTFDLANKENYEFFQMLKNNAFKTAWDFSNAKKAKWPFVTNSYIDQNNLPAGNDITVTGASSSTYFDFTTLDEIIDWSMRWNGLSAEGDIRPTGRIRLPSSHVKKFGSTITPGGATSNKVADELLEKGWTGVRYRDINWVFIGDATLPASEHICYPEFNFKPARYWKKNGKPWNLDVTRTGEHDRALFESGEQERQVRTNYAASINTANLRKLARFKYKT